jgi:large subunit ribosomal protein L24e
MVRCNFCKKDIGPGTGKMFIYKEGRILHLCSSKCEKNAIGLKRNPANVRWTQQVEE